jgi:hypothetical protein
MQNYGLTHRELATAEAITDNIMTQIGEEPHTDDIFKAVLNPLAHHAVQALKPLTKPANDALYAAGGHVAKVQKDVEKGAKDFHKDFRKRTAVLGQHGRPPAVPFNPLKLFKGK